MIIAALFACQTTASPPPPEPVMLVDSWSPPPSEVALRWSMQHVGEALVIAYEVTNHAATSVWLADRLLSPGEGGAHLHDRPAVVPSGRPGVALVAIGAVPHNTTAYLSLPPVYREVKAGETTAGTCKAPWPLTTWHPQGRAASVGEPTSVIFALDMFFGEPAGWKPLLSDAGEAIRVPNYQSRHWLWTSAQPLPPD